MKVIANLDAEKAVLGIILEQPEVIESVHGILPSHDMFYDPSNSTIYKAVLSLWKANKPIDTITVKNELTATNQLLNVKNGIVYIIDLLNNSSTINYIHHSLLVKEQYIRRSMIKHCNDMVSKCYDQTEDILKLQDSHINQVEKLTEIKQAQKSKDIDDIKRDFIDEVKNAGNKKAATSIFTGINTYDKIIMGFRKGTLNIVGGRPGMGKTSLIKSILRQTSIENTKTTMFFSLEMTATQVVKALVAELTQINSKKFTTGEINYIEEQAMMSALSRIKNNIIIDDTPAITIRMIKRRIAKAIRLYGNVDMILIDYLQLMGDDDSKGNREQEVSYNSKKLKEIAKENDVPVILLSQLSREVEKRNPPRPKLSDLRESGSIEQDADSVTFIYRPEYYGYTEDANGDSLIGKAELIIAKNREGDLGTANVRFIKEFTQLTDWTQQTEQNQQNFKF